MVFKKKVPPGTVQVSPNKPDGHLSKSILLELGKRTGDKLPQKPIAKEYLKTQDRVVCFRIWYFDFVGQGARAHSQLISRVSTAPTLLPSTAHLNSTSAFQIPFIFSYLSQYLGKKWVEHGDCFWYIILFEIVKMGLNKHPRIEDTCGFITGGVEIYSI